MIKQTAIDIEVFVYTCKHEMSKHIIKDSKIHKLLHAELESKGVGVFVKDINDWVRGLPCKSSTEVLWRHRNDEHAAILSLLFNCKVPNGWHMLKDTWNNNAVVNIVKNNHIKGSDNVPVEYARIGLVGNQPNQPKAIPVFYKNTEGTMLHHNVASFARRPKPTAMWDAISYN